MHAHDRSILATLAYYGAFSWPLTPLEVHAKLIVAARLGGLGDAPELVRLMERLSALRDRGEVSGAMGLYGPLDLADSAFDERVRREKECARKWRVLRRSAGILQVAPFIRALLASGSLALGNTSASSDWDMLVVARGGRLYTARAFLLAVAWPTGRLRRKEHSVAPDRYCFNHWLSDEALALRHRSLFTASVLTSLVPLWDPAGFLAEVCEANRWTEAYVPRVTLASFVRRESGEHPFFGRVRRLLEYVLGGRAGDALEGALKRWQQGRIAAQPATHAEAGRIIADDSEIEFHPRSFEAMALARYNAALSGFGLGAFAEPDSGLTV
jgi:hypothetical protein